jgi:hypothetical protein
MLIFSISDPITASYSLERTACRTKLHDAVIERRVLPMTADEKSLGSPQESIGGCRLLDDESRASGEFEKSAPSRNDMSLIAAVGSATTQDDHVEIDS